MHNIWLIFRREYLERVRTKSFLVSTLLLPAFIFGITVLPSKLATMKSTGMTRIVVVASHDQIADGVDQELHAPEVERKYKVERRIGDDAGIKSSLDAAILNNQIDGYVWLTDRAIAEGKVVFAAYSSSDFGVNNDVIDAANKSILRERLVAQGVRAPEAEAMLKPVKVDLLSVGTGKRSKNGEMAEFFAGFLVAMTLYITLLMYGMMVMRSVLDEKSSRVMEVMLSSTTPKALMSGKLLGVGAVGVTQMLIWAGFILLFNSPSALASSDLGKVFSMNPMVLVFLPVYFVLGFLLYSGLYAALGAAVNSDQEAQQWQWFVTMPLVIPIILASRVIMQPDGAMATWLSMVPFFSPILMYVRILVHTPPAWQIVLSIVLLVATIYAAIIVSSRIYRVGILMYGKRPTLPEIIKWLKYA